MSTLYVNTITPNSGDTVTISGSLTTTGKLTIGDATTDTVAITAEITSSLIPDLDNIFDLGSSIKRWKDLHVDGTGSFTHISASGNVDFNGDLDVDGTTNLDVVDIDGAVNMASTLIVLSITASRGISSSGDIIVDGAVSASSHVSASGLYSRGNLEVTGNTIVTNITATTMSLATNGTGSFGMIVATGDISASGVVYAQSFQSPGDTEIDINDSLNIVGGITASGGISSSGDIIVDGAVSASSVTTDTLTSGLGTIAVGAILSSSANIITDGNISSSGNLLGVNLIVTEITASGHISSSGHVSASAQKVLSSSLSYISLPDNTVIESETNPNDTSIKLNADDYWSFKANGVETARFTSAGVTVNDGGVASADFRAESDSNTHMLYVDAGNNAVGINNGGPSASLDILGDLQISQAVTASGGVSASFVNTDTLTSGLGTIAVGAILSSSANIVTDGTVSASGGIITDTLTSGLGTIAIGAILSSSANIVTDGDISSSGTIHTDNLTSGLGTIAISAILSSSANIVTDGNISASGVMTAGDAVTDEHNFKGHFMTQYMEFLADVDPIVSTVLSASVSLEAVTFTDADCDAGVTLSSSAVHTCAWDSGATSAVTLPAATIGNFVIWRQSGLADEANAVTFTCAGTDNFESNQIVHAGGETAGDASAAIASADKALAITPAATNCGWGQVGSQVSFYCRTAGRWLVRVKGRNLGTGTGGTIAFA